MNHGKEEGCEKFLSNVFNKNLPQRRNKFWEKNLVPPLLSSKNSVPPFRTLKKTGPFLWPPLPVQNYSSLTVCLLIICKGFQGISLHLGVVATWGFHIYFFLHLMTFLVTLTCDSTLLLEIWAFLGQFEHKFRTTITKRSILIRLGAWMFCNGHVPDEYQPDVNKKNWFYPDLTNHIGIPPAKLQNGGFSTFREIYR